MGALYILLVFGAGLVGATVYDYRRADPPEHKLFGWFGTAVAAWCTLWFVTEAWYHFTVFTGTVGSGIFWCVAAATALALVVAGVRANLGKKAGKRRRKAPVAPPAAEPAPPAAESAEPAGSYRDAGFWLSRLALVAWYGLLIVGPAVVGALFLFVSLAYLLGFGERVDVHVTGLDPYQPSEGTGYYLLDGVQHQVPISFADPGDTFVARFLVIPAWQEAPITDFAFILALLALGIGLVAVGLTIRHFTRRHRARPHA